MNEPADKVEGLLASIKFWFIFTTIISCICTFLALISLGFEFLTVGSVLTIFFFSYFFLTCWFFYKWLIAKLGEGYAIVTCIGIVGLLIYLSVISGMIEIGPHDYDEQVFLDTKAGAESGFAPAQYNLGEMYRSGKGISVNKKEAVKWYRKAAEQNEPRAQYNLGYMYYNKEALPRDYKKAVYWFTKAAEQGNSAAQFNLGFVYENGEGVEKNLYKALKWHQKAADQGHVAAKENIKQLLKENPELLGP
jgi:hypothetical protein